MISNSNDANKIGIAYWGHQAHMELIVNDKWYEYYCGGGSSVHSHNRHPEAIFFLNLESLGMSDKNFDQLNQDLKARKVTVPQYKFSCSYSITHILESYSAYRFPPILVLSPTFFAAYLNFKQGSLVESLTDFNFCPTKLNVNIQTFKNELNRPMVGLSRGPGQKLTVGEVYAVASCVIIPVGLVCTVIAYDVISQNVPLFLTIGTIGTIGAIFKKCLL